MKTPLFEILTNVTTWWECGIKDQRPPHHTMSSLFFYHQERHLALFSYLLYLWDTDVAGSMVSAALSALLFWFNLSGCNSVTEVFPILWIFKKVGNVYPAVLILNVQSLCRCWSMSSLYCHLFVFLSYFESHFPSSFYGTIGIGEIVAKGKHPIGGIRAEDLAFIWLSSFCFLRVFHLRLSWLDLRTLSALEQPALAMEWVLWMLSYCDLAGGICPIFLYMFALTSDVILGFSPAWIWTMLDSFIYWTSCCAEVWSYGNNLGIFLWYCQSWRILRPEMFTGIAWTFSPLNICFEPHYPYHWGVGYGIGYSHLVHLITCIKLKIAHC